MSETPLPNEPEARTPTGELKDQANPTNPNPTPKPGDTPSPTETPDNKSGEEKKDEPKKEEAKTGAPEKYEPFTIPEGHELNEKVVTEASAIFKELGLDQAAAQRLVDFHIKHNAEVAEAPYKTYADTRKGWLDELKNDPQIGSKLDEVKVNISKFIDTLGEKESLALRKALDITGAGDNPAVVRAFHALATKFGEGTIVPAPKPSPTGQDQRQGARPSAAAALYPNLP